MLLILDLQENLNLLQVLEAVGHLENPQVLLVLEEMLLNLVDHQDKQVLLQMLQVLQLEAHLENLLVLVEILQMQDCGVLGNLQENFHAEVHLQDQKCGQDLKNLRVKMGLLGLGNH